MSEIDRRRIAALTESENEKFRNRTGVSAETYKRALEVMPNARHVSSPPTSLASLMYTGPPESP